MTIGVETEGLVIIRAAPIARKFIGQPLQNLINWMYRQGGLRIEEIHADSRH